MAAMKFILRVLFSASLACAIQWELQMAQEPVEPEVQEPAVPVLSLNRFLFEGNVQCRDGHADHWLVLFCAPWHLACEQYDPLFTVASNMFEEKFNSGRLMRSHVRFAKVNCATDKELCNSNHVDAYPTVVRYSGGDRVSQWTPGASINPVDLLVWMDSEMNQTEVARDASYASLADKRDAHEPAPLRLHVLLLTALLFAVIPAWIVIVGSDPL